MKVFSESIERAEEALTHLDGLYETSRLNCRETRNLFSILRNYKNIPKEKDLDYARGTFHSGSRECTDLLVQVSDTIRRIDERMDEDEEDNARLGNDLQNMSLEGLVALSVATGLVYQAIRYWPDS